VAHLDALVDSGLDTALLPTERGGAGMSLRTFGPVLAAISRGCPATGCIWLMHVGAAYTLTALSPEPAASRFADEWREGRRFANALSEPTSGNLFLTPLQDATPTADGWELSGAKRFVSGCEIADYFLVNARVDGLPGFFGVERDESASFVPIWDTMGMRATRSQLVSFGGTTLRADRRCRPPQPSEPNVIGLGLAWLSIGIGEAALAALVEHAQGRVIPTTGEPLAAMQWVRFDVAEAHVTLRAARLLAAQSMWEADRGDPAAHATAVEAKLYANQVAKAVAELGVRVGGGSGYLRSSPIQRHFRDAQAGALMAWSVEVCRDAVGHSVLGTAG
jgi:alkylation response protein AidB-like acyl-CoA dehydrogenase